ncbi:hypothetical protein GF354_05845 [Candidatus Peregrinibacteria bacterium]|nr:hypothetical protein [Candidatus Peregrinibacteria bacterium]
MTTIKIETEVKKETHELALALGKVIVKIKEKLSDGFQPGDDISEIIGVVTSELIPAVAGAEKIPSEAAADPVMFAKTIAISLVAEVVPALLEKK